MGTLRHAKFVSALFRTLAAVVAAFVCAAALMLAAPNTAYAYYSRIIDLNTSYTVTLTGQSGSYLRYKFTTPSAGVVRLSIANEQDQDSSIHVNLHEFTDAPSSTPLYGKTYETSSTSFTSPRIGLPSNTTYSVYLRWNTSGDKEVKHKVTITVEFEERSDWETERNSTISMADAIALGTAVSGNNATYSGTDFDYYKFTAPESGLVFFTFEMESPASDDQWSVQIIDASSTTSSAVVSRVVSADESPYMELVSDLTAGKTYYAFVSSMEVSSDDAGYTLTLESPESAGIQAMYRLYNPYSGEHFYTASTTERDYLDGIGWNYEGIGWFAPVSSSTPVYRLYNPTKSPKTGSGEHHYTMSVAERDSLVKAGWKDEGIGWYSDDDKTVPLYRVYNPNEFNNNHHYTIDTDERDWLLSLGWRDEGIAWYAS